LASTLLLRNQIDEIITPSYLKGISYLHAGDEELPKFIAALFYQVEPDKAIQIVFTDRIKRALNENDVDDLLKISSISEFYDVLENAISDVSNYENAILALNDLPEDKIGNKYQAEIIWNCLFKKLEPRAKSQISEFQLILLSKMTNQKEYLKIILNGLVADPEFAATSYVDSINAIENKFTDTLQVFSELKTKQTSVQDFINFVGKAKSEYAKYKIKTDQKEINDYLIALEIPKLKEVDFIPYLTNEYSFIAFTKNLEELIKTNAPNNDKEIMGVLYGRYKEVRPLKEKLEDSYVYTLFTNSTEKEDFYYDLIAMRIAKLEKFNASYISPFDAIFQSADENLVTNIANRLEYYLDYGSILLGLKTFSNPFYKEVAKNLTVKSVGTSRATVSKLVASFQEICELGEIEPKTLLKRLNAWESFFTKEISKDNIKQTASPFFLEQSIGEDFSICTHCINTVNEYLNSLTEEEWKASFKDLDSYEIQVSLIVNHKFTTNASEALKDILKDIAVGSISLPDKTIMEKLISKLQDQGRSLKGTFNTVRDSICREDCMTVPLFKFFGDWLFLYADLEKNQSSLRTIFTSDVIRDNECLEIILSHQEKMPAIISSATEEAQDFKEIIKDKLTNDASENFVAFAKSIGVELKNDEVIKDDENKE
jgi:hypothetical protein